MDFKRYVVVETLDKRLHCQILQNLDTQEKEFRITSTDGEMVLPLIEHVPVDSMHAVFSLAGAAAGFHGGYICQSVEDLRLLYEMGFPLMGHRQGVVFTPSARFESADSALRTAKNLKRRVVPSQKVRAKDWSVMG